MEIVVDIIAVVGLTLLAYYFVILMKGEKE